VAAAGPSFLESMLPRKRAFAVAYHPCDALLTLGECESGTARLEEAVAVFDMCLTITDTAWLEERAQQVRSHRDKAPGGEMHSAVSRELSCISQEFCPMRLGPEWQGF
jgi:hypothetical protein